MTGPSARSMVTGPAFQDDERGRNAAFVGDAHVNVADPSPPDEVCERLGQLEIRPAGRMVHHPDVVPVHRRSDAGSHRFRESLLRGEALRQVRSGFAMSGESLVLACDEDSVRKAVAVARERRRHARDLDEIGADPDDHRRPRTAARVAASTMSNFISRTASRMPTKTARLTMACPMWSSRTAASWATGSTLT